MAKAKVQKNLTAPKDTGKDKDRELVDSLVKKFNASWTYAQQNYHKRWEDAYKLYSNKRTDNIGYEGVSNVFVPMTFSTIEAMTSALAGGKPSFDYLPPANKPDQKTDILNALIDFYWDKDQWTPKIESFIRDCLIYGTAVGYLYWSDDHPVLLNIPIRDFFFNPNATGIENPAEDFYAGRRYFTSLEELKTYEVVEYDEDGEPTGNMVKKFKNLDQVTPGKTGENQSDKEFKDMFNGSAVPDAEKNQVEVIELWTEDRYYCVANRQVVILDEENVYKRQHKQILEAKYLDEAMQETDVEALVEKGKEAKIRADMEAKGIIPFIIQRDYSDPSLLLGRGEVDTIAPLQEMLNDVTNQTNDFISMVVNPTTVVDPALKDLLKSGGIVFAPGAAIPARPDQVKAHIMPNLPPEAFASIQNIKNEIRETTAASEVVKGVSSDTQVTATEINAQVAQAGARIKMKAVRLENESFHRLARIVFQMVKLYVNNPMQVRVVTDTVSWQEFNPAEFDGVYEPRVQLETTVEAQKSEDRQVSQEMYLALAADPSINQEELKRLTFPKIWQLDADEIDRLLTPPAPSEDMSMLGLGGAPTLPSGQPAPGIELPI